MSIKEAEIHSKFYGKKNKKVLTKNKKSDKSRLKNIVHKVMSWNRTSNSEEQDKADENV